MINVPLPTIDPRCGYFCVACDDR